MGLLFFSWVLDFEDIGFNLVIEVGYLSGWVFFGLVGFFGGYIILGWFLVWRF